MRYIILLIAIVFSGCTEKMISIPNYTPIITERVVLIEELTGASCPNCPIGTQKLDDIIERYGNQVVAVAIHGDFLAEPITDKSTYDFRNPEGSELEDYLKPWDGKPAASINRIAFDQFEFSGSSPDLWDQRVNEELQKTHVLELSASQYSFDPVTRTLDVTFEIIPLVDFGAGYNLSVMYTESHVRDAQKDVTEILEDYEFNHILRGMMTATTGDALNPLVMNTPQTMTLSTTLPTDTDHAELFDPENMELVAFVHHNTTKEVLQAFSMHVQ